MTFCHKPFLLIESEFSNNGLTFLGFFVLFWRLLFFFCRNLLELEVQKEQTLAQIDFVQKQINTTEELLDQLR